MENNRMHQTVESDSMGLNASGEWNRRQFLRGGLTMAASASSLAALSSLSADSPPQVLKPVEFKRKIKLGIVGNGGRGAWIGRLFRRHGGFEIHAVADYFEEVANRCGDQLGVSKDRRFWTLSGFKKLIESGVEAVALETPPYFFPEHARAAVEAGLHVYLAKPVAVDVLGALEILAAGIKATERKLCFLVDYQISTDPHNIEIARRVRSGEIGKPAIITSRCYDGGWPDPPLTATLESRLQRLIWCNDIALGGSHHVNSCIHAIDSVLWVLGKRPVSATGFSRIVRDNPHGDSPDAFSISLVFEDGLGWDHCGRNVNNMHPYECSGMIHGTTGFAQVSYLGRVRLQGPESSYAGEVVNLYEAGAVRNIADFYRLITEGHYENTTVARAVDGVLTTILSREATMRRTQLAMDELIRENQRLEPNLKGMKS